MIIKTMWKVLKQMLKDFETSIKKNLNRITKLIQLLYPVIMFYLKCNIKQIVLICICVNIITAFLNRLHYELNGTIESGLPIPARCFTRVNSGGYLSFKEDGDELEALQYLNELEAYLKARGVIK